MDQPEQHSALSQLHKSGWWDTLGLFLGLSAAVLLVFIAETNSAAEWIARHKDSKIDEAIAALFVAAVTLTIFIIHKCRNIYRALTGATNHPEIRVPEATQIRKSLRNDAAFIVAIILAAVLMVFLFDTGSLAEWIGRHKDTKIDELIVATVLLLIGGSFFCLRRWIELSRQLIRYEVLYSKTSELHRQSTLLAELSDLLQSSPYVSEAQQLISEHSERLFPHTSGAVCLINSSRNLVEVVSTWGNPALSERYFTNEDCWGLRRGHVHAFKGDSGVLRCPHSSGSELRSAMCVPLLAHGETLGLLYIQKGVGVAADANSPGFSIDEGRLAKTLAEQASLALANLKLREVLKNQTIRDPLTGLFNRRFMVEALDRELIRAARKKLSLGIMMIDVDHFKRLNDTYGHEAGDTVLRELGSLFATTMRGSDIVCRYGGEEFTAILPEAAIEAVEHRAEQLREAVKKLNLEIPENVTISIGISAFPENGGSAADLLRSADTALYNAKQQGRDRVLMARAN